MLARSSGIVKVWGCVYQEVFKKQLPPCIMCVQHRGGCSVPWGCSVPRRDIMSTVGGLSWVPWGMFSTVGDIMMHVGDIMMHVGDIMSTMEGVQYRGGKSLLLFEYPMVLNTPTVLTISPTCIMISPHGTQISKDDIPHGTEHPHSTQDIPHIYHDIPHSTEHPHGTQDIPHGTHDIPHGTEHPPRYWAPPTVLHTHYTGWLLIIKVWPLLQTRALKCSTKNSWTLFVLV